MNGEIDQSWMDNDDDSFDEFSTNFDFRVLDSTPRATKSSSSSSRQNHNHKRPEKSSGDLVKSSKNEGDCGDAFEWGEIGVEDPRGFSESRATTLNTSAHPHGLFPQPINQSQRQIKKESTGFQRRDPNLDEDVFGFASFENCFVTEEDLVTTYLSRT